MAGPVLTDRGAKQRDDRMCDRCGALVKRVVVVDQSTGMRVVVVDQSTGMRLGVCRSCRSILTQYVGWIDADTDTGNVVA